MVLSYVKYVQSSAFIMGNKCVIYAFDFHVLPHFWECVKKITVLNVRSSNQIYQSSCILLPLFIIKRYLF